MKKQSKHSLNLTEFNPQTKHLCTACEHICDMSTQSIATVKNHVGGANDLIEFIMHPYKFRET